MEVSSGRALDLCCFMGVRGGGRGGFDDYHDDNRELEIISQHEDIERIFYRRSEYRSCQGISGWMQALCATELPCSDER